MQDELGEGGPAGDGSGKSEGGADEASGVEDWVEAEVSEVVACL